MKKKRVEIDVHHLVNRCNGWSNDPSNLVTMKRKKHEARHTLFENLWFKEALMELFLMGEKCLKDWPLKRELRNCLMNIDYKPGVFKGMQPPKRVQSGKE